MLLRWMLVTCTNNHLYTTSSPALLLKEKGALLYVREAYRYTVVIKTIRLTSIQQTIKDIYSFVRKLIGVGCSYQRRFGLYFPALLLKEKGALLCARETYRYTVVIKTIRLTSIQQTIKDIYCSDVRRGGGTTTARCVPTTAENK